MRPCLAHNFCTVPFFRKSFRAKILLNTNKILRRDFSFVENFYYTLILCGDVIRSDVIVSFFLGCFCRILVLKNLRRDFFSLRNIVG